MCIFVCKNCTIVISLSDSSLFVECWSVIFRVYHTIWIKKKKMLSCWPLLYVKNPIFWTDADIVRKKPKCHPPHFFSLICRRNENKKRYVVTPSNDSIKSWCFRVKERCGLILSPHQVRILLFKKVKKNSLRSFEKLKFCR